MFNSFISYCKGSYEELAHKTTWPTRKELTHSAVVVLVASIVIALIVFCMDTVFDQLMKLVYSA
ncbi:MAG: preprotein translocase subunit SecE [Alloprevotella sp.]|nr:preprotein translocase subunit SecE [Alloprevotella sp.]MBR1446172.1 preprotein translocase subunit SecE [Alloprevotella sp.]